MLAVKQLLLVLLGLQSALAGVKMGSFLKYSPFVGAHYYQVYQGPFTKGSPKGTTKFGKLPTWWIGAVASKADVCGARHQCPHVTLDQCNIE